MKDCLPNTGIEPLNSRILSWTLYQLPYPSWLLGLVNISKIILSNFIYIFLKFHHMHKVYIHLGMGQTIYMYRQQKKCREKRKKTFLLPVKFSLSCDIYHFVQRCIFNSMFNTVDVTTNLERNVLNLISKSKHFLP